MAQQRLDNPKFQAFDDNGDPLSGGKLYAYEAGTSTPKTVYSDVGMTAPHASPVVLNDRGEALIYFTGQLKIDLYDADDVQITGYPIDYVEGAAEDYGEGPFDIVANEAALGTGETDGQCRVAADTGTIFRWDAGTSAWIVAGYQLCVASVGAIGTGVFDGQLRIDAGTGNRYTWDEDSGKWRVMPGNIYASDPSDSTYTVEPGTKIINTALGNQTRVYALVDEAAPDYGWIYDDPEQTVATDHVEGLGLALAVDADHDITIAAGHAWSSGSNRMYLTAAITKRIDSGSWAAGTNQGGLQGAVAADTKYYIFLVMDGNDDTVDAGFDTSADAANLLAVSSYTEYKCIGVLITDSAANIADLVQYVNRDKVRLRHGSYTGDGVGDRIINIGVDLLVSSKKHLILKSEGAASAVQKFGHEAGDVSDFFTSSAQAANIIQAWVATGFEVGTDGNANANGVVFNYVLFFVPGEDYFL